MVVSSETQKGAKRSDVSQTPEARLIQGLNLLPQKQTACLVSLFHCDLCACAFATCGSVVPEQIPCPARRHHLCRQPVTRVASAYMRSVMAWLVLLVCMFGGMCLLAYFYEMKRGYVTEMGWNVCECERVS